MLKSSTFDEMKDPTPTNPVCMQTLSETHAEMIHIQLVSVFPTIDLRVGLIVVTEIDGRQELGTQGTLKGKKDLHQGTCSGRPIASKKSSKDMCAGLMSPDAFHISLGDSKEGGGIRAVEPLVNASNASLSCSCSIRHGPEIHIVPIQHFKFGKNRRRVAGEK